MTDLECTLTQERAEQRRTSVNPGVQYHLFLDLQKGENFNGVIQIDFSLNNTDYCFFDYCGKEIDSLIVNGKDVKKIENSYNHLRKDGFLNIEKEYLKENTQNTVLISYYNKYHNDGNGMQSYTDIDGSQYLYTQGEPHFVNRVFPCFDQPDIKGKFKLYTKAPKDWKVISVENISKTENFNDFKNSSTSNDSDFIKLVKSFNKEDENATFLNFENTENKLLSTYFFAIISGPYEEIVCPSDKLYNNLTMSIFVRKTLHKYAIKQQTEIFEFNSDSIKRYEELFGFKYPFSKADSIFCPEYTVGAMENPGCITYHEHYIYKKVPSMHEITNRASTINHELAHMWFGNTVTMKWWDNLWLNESFADFVCYIILSDQHKEMTFPITYGWSMMSMRKGWGYREDQLDTTHPIAAKVPDTSTAESIFDGITYSKGAATMRQLYAVIGRENFSKAMKVYFNKFAFSNATLDDLLNTMQEVISQDKNLGTTEEYDLSKFKRDWIETAGMNEVKPVWSKDDKSKNAKLTLIQGHCLPQYPTLRYHKMQVGFYADDGTLIEAKEIFLKNQKETVIEYDGSKDVVAIIPNVGDYSFIKIILDEQSINWAMKNISKVQDELTRALVWRSMFDMVRDCRLKSVEMINICSSHFSQETNSSILQSMTAYCSLCLFNYCPEKFYDEKCESSWLAVYGVLTKTKDEEVIKAFKPLLLSFGRSKKAIEVSKDWIEGKCPELNHLSLTLGEKWKIVFKVYACKHYSEDVCKLLHKTVEDEDTTDTKVTWRHSIDALLANEEQREELWKDFTSHDSKVSFSVLGDKATGFNNKWIPYEQRQKYFSKYYECLIDYLKKTTTQFGMNLFSGLMPIHKTAKESYDEFMKLKPKAEELNDMFKVEFLQHLSGLSLKMKIEEYNLS
jgi:aminopeptidase N